MAKSKTAVDKVEIDEIINLYIKEQGGIVPELKYKALSNFNIEIANTPKYKRSNGELFKLYKYNFWGGSYNGEYNYGKRRIMELNEKNKVQVVGKEFDSDMADIVAMINNLHKKPQELTRLMIKLFEKERKKAKETQIELAKQRELNELLIQNIEALEDGITNLIFHSQSPNNSLNNMLNLSKSADSICYDELKNMFGNTDRFERFKTIEIEKEKDNIVSIEELNRLKRLKELENEGF